MNKATLLVETTSPSFKPMPDTPSCYPRLIKRVRAGLIDSVVIPVAAMTTLIIGDAMGASGTAAKLLLLFVPIFLLEPVMLSLTGGTIGHHIMKLQVSRQKGGGHINIFAATARFLIKLLFGWLSFVFVFTTKKHQAIHDLAAGSVVTYRNAGGLPAYEMLPERSIEEAGFVYPAAWKRIMAICLYGFVVVVGNAVFGLLALSDACARHDHCVGIDSLLLIMADVIFLIMIGAVIVMGWKGRLYGCRRKAI
jgi:uncharacterized RDD family membrane protein YckC